MVRLASFFIALTSALLIATASATAAQVAAAPCNDDGWCWESPLPQGNDYRAAWAAADDDVWIVGARTVVHWNGKQAVRVAAPAVDLQAVFGTAADDVWAWSNGTDEAPQFVLIHWDGKLWSPVAWPVHEHGFPSLGRIAGVWGTRGDVRFMAGNRGEIVHWDGTRFALEPALSPPLGHVWGAANGMAFGLAPGNDTVKAVYFGRGRSIAQKLFSGEIFSDNQLHAVAADDVTIVSSKPLHWDGHSLTPAKQLQQANNLIYDVWGRDRAFAVGHDGTILHYERGAWRALAGTNAEAADWRGAFISSQTDAWVVGDHGAALRRDAAGWHAEKIPTPNNLSAVWGAGSEVWAVGEVIAHRAAGAWSIEAAPAKLAAIWGVGPDLRFAVGKNGTILKSAGATWQPMESGTKKDLTAVSGTAANNVWVLGTEATVLHFDGKRWTTVVPPGDVQLYSVFAAPGGDVWVTGTSGVSRRHGEQWSSATPPGAESANYLIGRANDDLWLVDLPGFYWDGARWTYGQRAFHWDGASWTATALPLADQRIDGVAVSGDQILLAGDHDAVIGRHAPLPRSTPRVSAAPLARVDSVRKADGPFVRLEADCGEDCKRGCSLPRGTRPRGKFLELRPDYAYDACALAVRLAGGWYVWGAPDWGGHGRSFGSIRIVGDRLEIGVVDGTHRGEVERRAVCGIGPSGDLSCTGLGADENTIKQALEFP